MKMVGKGFSGRVTSLFPTMVVPQPSGPTDIVIDEAVHKELGDSLVRATTTASSLEVEQDSGNITKTRSKATPNESSSLGTTSGGGPRCQETMRDTIAQTMFENVSKLSNDSLLVKAWVESSGDEHSLGKDASKQGRRINVIDANEDITLVNVQDDADNEMFDVNALNGEEVFVVGQNENVVEEVVDVAQVSTLATTATITTEEITLAQALEAIKTSKPKVKGIDFQEPEEHVKTMKKKDLIRLDEEIASKLQAKFDKEKDLQERKLKKNKKPILQAEEQEELSVEEKAKLFQQLLEKRRKHFAAKSAEEKRNKPPTQAQQRKIMCIYLKNMEGKKPKDLKNKSFDSIQKMFDRAFKRVTTFIDFRTDLVEGSSKRAGEELEQESTKKQKVDEDKDIAELQSLMKVIPDKEEVEIDAIPLATKIFSQMIKSFDREDLEDLYKLVKAKYGSTRPVEDMDLLLWNDMKIMFKPHVEDEVWKLL
ncbi:hypothetical protein Tco_0674201 [Tanacetum coccineum]